MKLLRLYITIIIDYYYFKYIIANFEVSSRSTSTSTTTTTTTSTTTTTNY